MSEPAFDWPALDKSRWGDLTEGEQVELGRRLAEPRFADMREFTSRLSTEKLIEHLARCQRMQDDPAYTRHLKEGFVGTTGQRPSIELMYTAAIAARMLILRELAARSADA